MRNARGAGNRHDPRRTCQQPGEGNLRAGRPVPGRNGFEDATDSVRSSGVDRRAGRRKRHRLPRDEDSPRFEGRVEKGLLLPGDDIEVGGDSDDIDDLTCGVQLVGGHVRETDMPDQPFLSQLREGADLVFERGILRPAAVQVVQIDLLDTEAPTAHVRTLAQVVGVADGLDGGELPTTADEAALGRDDQVLGIGVQCFAYQQFIGVGSIHVSRVDQGHARFDGLSQKRDPAVMVGVVAQRFGPVSRIAP